MTDRVPVCFLAVLVAWFWTVWSTHQCGRVSSLQTQSFFRLNQIVSDSHTQVVQANAYLC
jgi:hypothetical protein